MKALRLRYTNGSSTALVRQAIVAFLVTFGICSLL